LLIFAKKCKFLLIFTPIFTPKTEWSYKITLFTIANHPNFQNFPQKPLNFDFLFSFFPFFFSFFICCAFVSLRPTAAHLASRFAKPSSPATSTATA